MNEYRNAMEKPRKSTRLGAGENPSLSTEYIWQKTPGMSKNRNPNGKAASVIVEKNHVSKDVIDRSKSFVEINKNVLVTKNRSELHSEIFLAESVSSASIITSVSKTSSKNSIMLDLEKKRLALETERKIQEIKGKERKAEAEALLRKAEVEAQAQALQRKETADIIKLIELEKEVRNAELDAEALSATASGISVHSKPKSVNSQGNIEKIKEWMSRSNNEDKYTEVGIDLRQPNQEFTKQLGHRQDKNIVIENQNFHENQSSSKIKPLETIAIAIKTISENMSTPRTDQDTLMARQTMQRDFPNFDGNPLEWPMFFRQFKNIVSICKYTNEETMMKLQKALKGEAKTLVEGMMLTCENVDLVIRTLELRYGRPEFIIGLLINKIKNISTVRDANLEKIISFSAHVNNMVSTVKSLNSVGHLSNPQLLTDLVGKLPELLKLEWGKHMIFSCTNRTLNLEDFSIWLTSIAEAACNASVPVNTYMEKLKPKPERVYATHQAEIVCNYCEKHHEDKDCKIMASDEVDKRWEIVSKKRLCFSCLGKRHRVDQCRKQIKCGENGCTLLHHRLLHKTKNYLVLKTNETEKQDNEKDQENEETKDHRDHVYATNDNRQNVLLRMIPIKIFGPNGVKTVLALCDEASTVTLMDTSIAEELGLKGIPQTLCLQWTNENVTIRERSMRMDIDISKAQDSKKMFTLRNVRSIKNLSLPTQDFDVNICKIYSHLRDIPIDYMRGKKPCILIGQDNINLILVQQVKTPKDNSPVPVASKCQLGWSIHGPVSSKQFVTNERTLHICEKDTKDEEIHELIKKSFSIDSFGISMFSEKYSEEEHKAISIMENTIQRKNERYEIGLLWKTDNVKLPESKNNALRRLLCIEKKCRKNDWIAKEYCEKIDGYVQKGYVRKLSTEETHLESPHTWYLPHFCVENSNKPGKIRLVFDAAAKCSGVSLNDALLPGPDLLRSLVAILWRFRLHKFAFCGDIREMFHQVQIRREDRCAQRFLWRNLESNRNPDVYEMCVMTFGATCSPVCAQFVKNFTADHFSPNEIIQKAITENFYVDDYLDCKDTEAEVLETILQVRKTLSSGGFEIVNFVTNSELTREKLPKDLMASMKVIDSTSIHRVLGLLWNPEADNFIFKTNFDQNIICSPTKRNILKTVMALFDPLGLISSLTIQGRILMQDIWRSKCDWDGKLPENIQAAWRTWIQDLQKVTNLAIPRCYFSEFVEGITRIQLHSFSDSSEKAYSAAVYLRFENPTIIHVALVTAKSRVAPLKPLSIPRLELQAALMSSRLANSVKRELEITIEATYFWTDSKCILSWIRGDGRRYKQFVAHRVGEIQEITNVKDWKWVPTDVNVADEATKRKFDSQKVISENWFNGPDFLKQNFTFWPEEIETNSSEYPNDGDRVLEELKIENVLIIKQDESVVPDIMKFSNWLSLIRSTAMILRFLTNFINKARKNPLIETELTREEKEKAEIIWIRLAQQDSFLQEFQSLQRNEYVSRTSKIVSLCPVLENDVIVLGGRTDQAECMITSARRPVILHPRHPYTKLLVKHYHEKFRHQGTEIILNEIRQKYWITHGRAAVKSAILNCQLCKILRAKPMPPLMGQLPKIRLTPTVRAFVNVGMDAFGPIEVVVGRRREKRWGLIFTCLSVRAIHLEVLHSMNTDSTIMAIRRLIARRGQPKIICCDNGTNFKGANSELRRCLSELDYKKINTVLAVKYIEMKFNPPGAPHMGGSWERLIRITKKVLGKVLYDKSIKDEVLVTIFSEAECLINSRPLTRVSSDPNDLESLTPNHFLLGSSNGEQYYIPEFQKSECYRKEWRKCQLLIDSFWQRWIKEYLPTLNRRGKWNEDQKPIALDDIVVLVEDNTPRYSWKLGRIVAVYPGPDQRIRVVDVKTSNGTEYRRPVTKICRLEIQQVED